MKHLFIINPRAGKKSSTVRLMDQIELLRRTHGLTCETLLTGRAGDAEEMARRTAQDGETVRIYACGGDGTLNEVINGAAGAAHIEVTSVPIGTGNDFIKNFGADGSRFLDLKQLWDGPVHDLDLIECNGRVALTIACVGLDARVAEDVHKYSRTLLLSGSGAYLASIGGNFFKKLSRRMIVSCDGRTTIGEYITVCVCNGRYYGGGFMPVAQARMDDGILDVLIVQNVSHAMLLRLLPVCARGEAWKYPEIARHVRVKSLQLQSRTPLTVSLDGEILHARDLRIRISPWKIHFFAPVGASCNATARSSPEQ